MNDCISVIIPVYNPGESQLRRCVDSVLFQTYSDIELILINDGSTDGSDTICREFASKDNRVVYIQQENAGVSAARNKGIDLSKGKYICFVDSDDYVDPDYVQSMITAIKKSEADIVIQGLKQMRNGQIIDKEIFDEGIYHVSSFTEKQFDDVFYFCGPYCKLFRASVVKSNSISFPCDMSYGEDAVFYHSYLVECRIIELLSCTGYNYMVANQGALSTKTLPPEKFWQNQSNRRGAYCKLKNIFGLHSGISAKEQFCRLAGISGMLNSIFKCASEDADITRYLNMMLADSNFCFAEIRPDGFRQRLMLKLVKSNTKLSRRLLKMMYL